jgi:hypothetical protein
MAEWNETIWDAKEEFNENSEKKLNWKPGNEKLNKPNNSFEKLTDRKNGRSWKQSLKDER